MRILMLVASPIVTDPRVYNEAQALIKDGHHVTVIAWDREKQNPARQVWDGIDVRRLRIPLSPKYGLSVPPWHVFHLMAWQWQAYRRAVALNKETAFDAIHCHFLDTLPVGIMLKRKLGVPLIYDARDMYGYMMQASFPRWIADAVGRVEKLLISKSDIIIAVSEVMERCLKKITDRPVKIIMNCKPLQSEEYLVPGDRDKFTLLYIGTLHKARALEELIHAVGELSNVHCIIGGIGQADYVESIRLKCLKIPNISFVGKVAVDKVLPMTMEADVIFCMFDSVNPNNKIGMPNKLFEAMVCGRPIICTRGIYSGDFALQETIGLAVEYSEEALAQAIMELRDDPDLRERLGRNALNAAITKYNWQIEEKKLVGLYREIQG
jgi:glycosyltransferase involved in cell wall biosynthesis